MRTVKEILKVPGDVESRVQALLDCYAATHRVMTQLVVPGECFAAVDVALQTCEHLFGAPEGSGTAAAAFDAPKGSGS